MTYEPGDNPSTDPTEETGGAPREADEPQDRKASGPGPEDRLTPDSDDGLETGLVFEGRTVRELDLSEMPLALGHRVQIRPAGLGFKIHGRFVGMEKGSYLMLALDPLGADSGEVLPLLYPDNETRLFYTDRGVLNGFLCNVVAYKASPFRLLYLTYPHQGEFFTLRCEDRFSCHLPARLDLDGEELSGMVRDLSPSGCSVCLEHPKPDSLILNKGLRVELSFALLSTLSENRVRCAVRNLRLGEDRLVLGLEFTDPDQAILLRVRQFLDFLDRYRGLRENALR